MNKLINNIKDFNEKEVEIFVAKKLRLRRQMLNLSVPQIEEATGIAKEQIYKYENTTTRLSLGKLFKFAYFFKVKCAYFFEGLEEKYAQNLSFEEKTKDFIYDVFPNPDAKAQAIASNNFIDLHKRFPNIEDRDTLILMDHYLNIDDKNIRKSILTLVTSLGGKEKE